MTQDFVIVTRFGIGVEAEPWYEYRLRFLETLLIPSLEAQTDRDFTLLLAVDRRIPGEVKRRLEDLTGNLKRVAFLSLDFHGQIHTDKLSDAVAALKRSNGPTTISRIDDDDAVVHGVVGAIREQADRHMGSAAATRRLILGLGGGYAGFPEEAVLAPVPQIARDGASVMISTVQEQGDRFTPFRFPHHLMREYSSENGVPYEYVLPETMSFHYTQHRNADHITADEYREILGSDGATGATEALLGRFGVGHDRYLELGRAISQYRDSGRYAGDGETQIRMTNVLRKGIHNVERRLRRAKDAHEIAGLHADIREMEARLRDVQSTLMLKK